MGLFSSFVSTLTDADWLKRNATYGVAKESIVVLNNGAGPTAAGGAFATIGQTVAGSSGGFLAGIGPEMLGVIGLVGATTALSAGLSQMEYQQERKQLRNLYREEIGSVLGKAPRKVRDRDLEHMAAGNPERGIPGNRVIGEELKRMKRGRTLGVALSVMASLAAFGVVAYTAQIPAIAELGHGFTHMLVQGGIGVAAYNLLKQPLHWLGDRVMGLSKETTCERIQTLTKERQAGKAISREQVFSVFACANPELDALIKSRHGNTFDKLDSHARQDILNTIGAMIQVDVLTDAINSGRINASELAFAVEGQASGVVHEQVYKPQPKAGLLGKIAGAFSGVVNTLTGHHETAQDGPATNFAGRVGRKGQNELTHVERLNRGAQPTVRQTP